MIRFEYLVHNLAFLKNDISDQVCLIFVYQVFIFISIHDWMVLIIHSRQGSKTRIHLSFHLLTFVWGETNYFLSRLFSFLLLKRLWMFYSLVISFTPFQLSDYPQWADGQTHRLTDLQTHRLTDSQTHRLTNSRTHTSNTLRLSRWCPELVSLIHTTQERVKGHTYWNHQKHICNVS